MHESHAIASGNPWNICTARTLVRTRFCRRDFPRQSKNFRRDMCGFCGVVNTDTAVEASLISSMLRPLAKRGPDASGICLQDTLGFGHRRLSILDLTPASQQPMVDPQLGLGIVFNGCIYNFRELRSEL